MDLTTRCPNCGTVFQASLSDLQLRKGYIRCVQCAHIFDGYAEVVRDAAQPADPAAAASAADYAGPGAEAGITPAPAPDVIPPEAWDNVPPHVIRAGRPTAHSMRPQEATFRMGVAPWPDDGRAAGRSWNEPHVGLASEGGSDAPEESDSTWDVRSSPRPDSIVVDAHPAYRGSGGSAAPLLQDEDIRSPLEALLRFLRGMALVVLVILLFAQLVYVYRAQIAQAVPAVRPSLEQLCVPLHCRVPYARDISQISVIDSALKVADTAPAASSAAAPGHAPQPDEQHFVLRFTLRNQLGQPQQWPTLVLDLKDGAGTLVVRRNLSPAEYLGPTMAGVPFAARSDVLVQLPLTLKGMRINGYQLNLFFP